LLSIVSKLGMRSHVLSKCNKYITLRSTTGQSYRYEWMAGNRGKPETLNTSVHFYRVTSHKKKGEEKPLESF
ncbi:MAG: hypothetical protein ACXV2D_09205, partial [Halobacteriota archaeon]